MIAVDSCSFIAFMDDKPGSDCEAIRQALIDKNLVFPYFVIMELFTSPDLPSRHAALIREARKLPIHDGLWEKAGRMRSEILARKRKAHGMDALIAQCCIDNKAPLITRDADFRHYEEFGLVIWN